MLAQSAPIRHANCLSRSLNQRLCKHLSLISHHKFHLINIAFFVIIAKADVEKLLKASGVTSDAESLDVMMSKLEGKSIPELIKEGSKDLATMGGSGGAAPAGGAGAAPAEAAAEEKPKEEEPEEDVDMGDLFGGGDDDY